MENLINEIKELRQKAEENYKNIVKISVNSYGAGVERGEIIAYDNILELLHNDID